MPTKFGDPWWKTLGGDGYWTNTPPPPQKKTQKKNNNIQTNLIQIIVKICRISLLFIPIHVHWVWHNKVIIKIIYVFWILPISASSGYRMSRMWSVRGSQTLRCWVRRSTTNLLSSSLTVCIRDEHRLYFVSFQQNLKNLKWLILWGDIFYKIKIN